MMVDFLFFVFGLLVGVAMTLYAQRIADKL